MFLADPVSRDESKLGAVFQEDIAGSLLWIDTDAIVGDNSTGRRRDTKFFRGKLEHGSKWSSLGYVDHLIR